MQTVLKVVTQDGQGVMDRILGVIRRYGCNISSIAAGEVEDGVYDISIAFHTMGVDMELLGNRLSDLDFVKSWEKYNLETGFLREMVMGKITESQWESLNIGKLCKLDTVGNEVFFSYTGTPDSANTMVGQLRAQGIICTRTGPVCLGLAQKKEG